MQTLHLSAPDPCPRQVLGPSVAQQSKGLDLFHTDVFQFGNQGVYPKLTSLS